MKIASLITQYSDAFEQRYGQHLLPSQRHALFSMQQCRTLLAGEIIVHCDNCHTIESRPLSCGHRSCPQCQHHSATQWLTRQLNKLLPVDYFLVTFTLPQELRQLVWSHQKTLYGTLFQTAIQTLKEFGLNPKNFGAELGMTAVLHTHTRRLDYHPHVHVVVPGGGFIQQNTQWKTKTDDYLFNAFALATVFRAKFIAAMKQLNLQPTRSYPKKWVVDCRHIGRGKPALQYLSRYLYRGPLNEKMIVANRDGKVTFQYTESKTNKTLYRTLPGEQFLWLLIQHVLPKGFRRARDYGFLHGNAQSRLTLIRIILRTPASGEPPVQRPTFVCACCGKAMRILAVYPRWKMLARNKGESPPVNVTC